MLWSFCAETSTLLPPNTPSRGSVDVHDHSLFHVSFADTERYWLFRTSDLKLPPGLMLLTFMATQLFQFQFADTEPRTWRSPPTLINWYSSWLITLKFFWTDHTHVPLVPVRDSFLNEYKVLKNPAWCGFIMAVVIFMTHAAEFDMIHPPDVVEKSSVVRWFVSSRRESHGSGCRSNQVVVGCSFWKDCATGFSPRCDPVSCDG